MEKKRTSSAKGEVEEDILIITIAVDVGHFLCLNVTTTTTLTLSECYDCHPWWGKTNRLVSRLVVGENKQQLLKDL